MNDSKFKILLGVGGGIAAYKTIELASQLTQSNYDVHISMTHAATKFIQPLTFESVTRNKVQSEIFPQKNSGQNTDVFPHLYPATEADCFVLCPATADLMAKINTGIADDIVSCSALSLPKNCIKIICPAMNVNMWENETVQNNVKHIESKGYIRIGPAYGHQACGAKGYGRLADVKEVLDHINNSFKSCKTFSGKKILIFSGPTHEYIDPVRFIGNASSGIMGHELSLEFAHLGGQVDFVTGPVPEINLPKHQNIKIHSITSAKQMLEVGEKLFPQNDFIVFCAAVSDYRPLEQSKIKLKKSTQFNLSLTQNPDIAETLLKKKTQNQKAIGFALESEKGTESAIEKCIRKKFDGIILNSPDSIGQNESHFTFITSSKESNELGLITKKELSKHIIAYLGKL